MYLNTAAIVALSSDIVVIMSIIQSCCIPSWMVGLHGKIVVITKHHTNLGAPYASWFVLYIAALTVGMI